MKTFKIGGVHPPENKISAGQKIQTVALPKQAIIPLSQHLGAPAKAIVAKGDTVKVGQIIGEAVGFISANVHSSVSGTVVKVEEVLSAWGLLLPCVIIDVEGDEWMETIDRSDKIEPICKLTPEQIVEKVKAAGVVGLGGACFPTHVKLSPPPGKKAEVLIINAVECEPYLTCDHQLMMEHAQEIFIGVEILMKALEVERAVIGIENNKLDAIKLFKEMAQNRMNIEVAPLKTQYPQGGEKQLIDACIGRQVPSGSLPIEVGAVVQNVATVYAVYQAVQKNRPLIDRVITITGEKIEKPGNFLLRFGTPVDMAIEMAGGVPANTGKILGGGPMMGRAFINTNMPANKRISGLLFLDMDQSLRKESSTCIRCAKCVSACPMGIEPYLLARFGNLSMWEQAEDHNVMDCIECGCCQYTCPSHLPLLDYIRLGKGTVGNLIRTRTTK